MRWPLALALLVSLALLASLASLALLASLPLALALLASLALALLAPRARAEDLAVNRRLAAEGAGFAQATTEYSDRLHLDVAAEARIVGPLRVVAGVALGDTARPGVGIGGDVFAGGVAYLRYKAEGFSEPEGEIEVMLAVGRELDGLHLAGALAYGQDPEGNERDADVATSAQLAVSQAVHAGVAARYRDALGSTEEALVRDALAGGAATWRLGRFAVGALVGVAMNESHGAARQYGPGGTVSVGATF
jgi:hypothetical protein